MDLRNLRATYPLLLSYMETESYSKQYIQYIEKDILWIINESSHYAWRSYDDIYQTYVDKWSNKTTLNHNYRDWETDRKSTRLNSSHITRSRMPSSA